MIGFTCKNTFSRGGAAVLGALLLTACSTALLKPSGESTEPEGKQPPGAESAIPAQTDEQAAVPEHTESLTADLLYEVLLGEIAGQRGVLDVSGASYLQAARDSDDPRIAERALSIAVYGKRPDIALQAARRWVELAPDKLEARQALAALALRNGKMGEAVEQFDYLLTQQEANNGSPYQTLLTLLAREPDKKRALAVMAELASARPDDADAQFAYARLAVHAEDWLLAAQQIDRVLALQPGRTDALILRAQIALKQGQGALARQQFTTALQEKPDDILLRQAYARLLVDMDDFDAAREQYKLLLRKQPDNAQIVYSLALLSLEAGQIDDAVEMFRKLLKLGVQEQQAYYYLGAIAEDKGRRKEAIKWYSKVSKGEHLLEAQVRIANLEALEGDVSAARERLRKLRLAQPEQSQRLYLVEGSILSRIDWNEEAYKLYSDYLQTRPDDIEILYARSLVAERLGRIDQAEADMRHVLKIEPDNTRALNALGYTLADRTNRYDEALKLIERAYAQTPNDPAVIDSMGWVMYRLGRLAEAREYLQKAYDMTQDTEIAAHLGEVLWTMGDKDAALALWKKARDASPGNRLLEDTVRRFSP
ncbi:tetratricopeptide repeat protein [Thiogranum longum]|uniref:Tetratricopeptide repeat protein n=1 Tax=Thiogranum longum TaxID=1537524 RepID=A0A4R1HCN4_9GAMM|nr:tetratricopeptide repeat protein [Thiogranum longum]TCK19218.1 tetratricopeptide repeat protein [Thiogranum longum]